MSSMRRFSARFFFIILTLISLNSFAQQQSSSPYTFADIGDNRAGDRIYQKILNMVIRHNPEFIINNGDYLIHPGELRSWERFREISKLITVPYYLVAGNHDIDDERSQKVWREESHMPGAKTYYSFTRGPDLFVILNSNDPAYYQRIAGEQLEWLKLTLNSQKYRHQFVFLHHPFYMWKGAKHYKDAMDRYPLERDDLHNLFVERKVDIVFSGHEHLYRRITKDGIDYIISGGAGQPLYEKGTPYSFHNAVIVKVSGPRISVKVFDDDGVLKNEFARSSLWKKKK